MKVQNKFHPLATLGSNGEDIWNTVKTEWTNVYQEVLGSKVRFHNLWIFK